MSFAQKMFSFQGRMRRRDWWIGVLILIVAKVVLSACGNAVVGASMFPMMALSSSGEVDLGAMLVKSLEVQAIVSLVLLWPSLAIGFKRLHDRNRPGWWLLVLTALSWVQQGLRFQRLHEGGDLMSMLQPGLPGGLLLLVIVIVGIWLLIEMGFLDGTQGPNKYGPSPKGIEAV